MVYIHGGGFVMGTGTTQLSSPVPIVALGDVIVVIINYRTNVFGFFSTGDDVVKGNAGLKDQVMALKWVQENIESFGGDPNRVTLFGESAGGISTTYHLVSPMSRGLIRNVILQSGSLLGGMQRGPETQDSQMKRAFALGRIVGCEQTKTNELVECLQAVDFEILLANYTQTIAETGEHPMTNPFSPNSDGEFLTDSAERLFENPSNIAQVSAMIGELADEGNVVFSMVYPTYIEEEPIVNQTDYDMILDMMMINQVPTELARQTLKLIYLTDQQISDPTLDRKDGINHLLGDLWFVCPDIKTSKYMVSEGNDVYAYHWTHVPSTSLWGATWFGATHAEDLTFVFGSHFNEHMSQLYNRFTKDEIKLTKDVITYWTNFAKYGNPNSANDCLPDWPKFTVSEQAYKEIKIGFANGRLLNPLACEYINGIVPRIVAMEQRQDAQCDNTNSCDGI
ncbi:cholinesterase 1-like [Antedon mediterranea]|uniref:cholinesterase 1-like n=1 Tax=Antedon mediterranea TaxID=105859 RepID=UPI003AF79A5B